ncbi:pyruvate kinase [Ralstonia pseudosolanacearum]|uniref:pyruvate kinase n=1 Tax=Ralstonia pseudosolanacearum TaxID=1310165 RepID=UPI0020033943|nr:pyruvate kinase [Ralstonia pseudosolanacearum]MCK4155420.1 pyruvate kinase [Ralstonia pseudosolanacearum]
MSQRRERHTKIVATLGPASSSLETIRQLFLAGADTFRLNFSHGTHDDHATRLGVIREVESIVGRPIGVLLDLQGPKLRLGTFSSGPVKLVAGQPFRLQLAETDGNDRVAHLPHPEIFEAMAPGNALLIDDGRVRLRVTSCGADFAQTRVETGGKVSDRKGVNVPDCALKLSALTEKDHRDLSFGLKLGVDWVALSFVQSAQDIEAVRRIVGTTVGIMAKIEKPAAIADIEAIVAAADAVMVARGDLGVEMPPEEVPTIQKRLTRLCRAAGKPIVVATQMLDSMISSPAPTRAEASDVATAVYDGVDAVMLSAESASGEYPIEAVQMMARIIRNTERDRLQRDTMGAIAATRHADAPDAIGAAIRTVADTLPLSACVTYTLSGASALRVAHERPNVPIVGMTPRIETARRLALVWGVHAVHGDDAESVEDMVEHATHVAQAEGFEPGTRPFAIVAGMPFGTPGSTNLLRLVFPSSTPTN